MNAQFTSWTGATNTDWNTASNWSAGVPLSTTDVFIGNVTNDPVISSVAVAQSVYIDDGGILTVSATYSLTIISSTSTQSIWNRGTLENFGTLNINASVSVGNYGIYNQAILNNNSGGTINIDRCLYAGLYNSGTLTNVASITIGATSSVASYGIFNLAFINNNTGGIIKIDQSTYIGIYSSGTLNNNANITIGGANTVGYYACFNEGTLNNNTGGMIKIDSSTSTGLYNNATLNNNANITIGAASAVGLYGLLNRATFNNNTGGVINIDQSTNTGLYNNGPLTNSATITIGAVKTVGYSGIDNRANLNNNTGGIINIDRSTNSGLYNSGTINNIATIIIGAIASIGQSGFINQTNLNNNTGGIINIDRSTFIGLYNNTLGTLNNDANINIGATVAVGLYGIYNEGAFNNNVGGIIKSDRSSSFGIYNLLGTFNNGAIINVGGIANVGNYAIQNNALFNNNAGGDIKMDRVSTSGISLESSTFTNLGKVTIGEIVPISNLLTAISGTFSNNLGGILYGTGNIPASNFTNAGGTLSPGYSPGKMTFTASSDFTNSTISMEAFSSGGIGGTNFDLMVITGTATLGASTNLNLKFSYAIECNTTFDMITATSVSGTIPTGNISFTNSGAGNVTGVSVSYPGGNIIRITVTTLLDTKPPMLNCATLTTINYTTEAPNCVNNSDVSAPVAVDECEGNINGVGTRSDNASINAPWPLGTTIITWNFTDASSNIKACTQNVIVVDDDLPMITLIGATTIDVCKNDTYTDAGATANDNCDGNITPSIVTVNPVNTAIPATYTVTYNVSDAATNAATQVTRSVIVHELPVATCPAGFSACKTGGNITLSGATPSGGIYSGAGVSGGVFDPLIAGAGMHAITYTYTDGNGCNGTCTFVITVFNPPLLNVNDGMYYCTLADAISSSNTSDGEEIQVPAGTYMDPCIMVNKSLKFTAIGGPVIMNCIEMNGSSKDMTLGSDFTFNTLKLTLGKVHANGHNLKCGTIMHTSGSASYVVTD